MTNTFINDLQLNTGNLNCNITAHAIGKSFNNQENSIYSKPHTIKYNTSGGPGKYEFNFTVWGQGDIYLELLQKEEDIYNQVQRQVIERMPITIRTNDTNIFLDQLEVEVLVDELTLTHRGIDGKHHLSFTLECLIHNNGGLSEGEFLGLGSIPLGDSELGNDVFGDT